MSKAEDIAEKKQKIIEYFRTFPVYKHAANSVGISEDTLKRWRDEDEEFTANLNQSASAFFSMQVSKAKPEFVLERLERETFAPPKQEVQHSGDPIKVLLEKYDITEGYENDTKDDESVQGSPQSNS